MTTNLLLSFFLGIIAGMIMLTTCLTLAYIVLYNNKTVIKQKLQNKLNKKGILIEPESNDFNNFINSLPHE